MQLQFHSADVKVTPTKLKVFWSAQIPPKNTIPLFFGCFFFLYSLTNKTQNS